MADGFMGVKATGIEELMARLRNVAEKVPENARKVMHRGADRIVAEAKLQSPVDLHNLEEAIHKEVGYEARGRLKIDIVVDGIVNGVEVSRYAVLIHENYEWVTRANGPGPGTLAKMRANPGVLIGRKFLERALDNNRERLHKAMVQAITETVR